MGPAGTEAGSPRLAGRNREVMLDQCDVEQVLGAAETALPGEGVREGEEGHSVDELRRVDQGVHIGEFHNLEELAKDRTYEFCYICMTNKIRGTAAGFTLRPIAVR